MGPSMMKDRVSAEPQMVESALPQLYYGLYQVGPKMAGGRSHAGTGDAVAGTSGEDADVLAAQVHQGHVVHAAQVRREGLIPQCPPRMGGTSLLPEHVEEVLPADPSIRSGFLDEIPDGSVNSCNQLSASSCLRWAHLEPDSFNSQAW